MTGTLTLLKQQQMSQKADTILRGTEKEANAIVTLPGTW